MQSIDELVHDFLAQRRIAVAGVSTRNTGCNSVYHRLKRDGFEVYPVNPHLSTFEGDPCYPDLATIPQRPDAVFMFTRPEVTGTLVMECVELGIKHVWMHCMMGTKPGLGRRTSSVSPAAVALCRANGISVIAGSCPNQFLDPDFFHGTVRFVSRLRGFLQTLGS